MKKPLLSKAAIWNMSVGFLGIQAGFALQNANASRILQIFGADTHHLGWFWLVAPITGMIVQPIVGYYSDKTWTSMGRRKPYFLAGAILASIGLMLMPNAGIFVSILPALWVGAGMLMIMDVSFNISMEPFRALVADKLETTQRTAGYAIQTVLIGLGAVVGSWLPSLLGDGIKTVDVFPGVLENILGSQLLPGLGLETQATHNMVPQNVIWAFFTGAILLLFAILWTIISTKEYSPEEVKSYHDHTDNVEYSLDKNVFSSIVTDLKNMPETMKQLGLVQFCSWFALFGMWVYSTPAIAEHIYGLAPNDTTSPEFQVAGNKVGVLFGIYNLVSAIYAFALPFIAGKLGRKYAHGISLLAGGIGLISIYFITNPDDLVYSMIGVGMAWASILAMPYAMLAGSIPPLKMGIYMGIFNFFITIPQIVNGIIGGPLLKNVYGNHAIYPIVVAGILMIIGALACTRVKDVDDVRI
ncbi:MAG: MFS transporter [Saprospiraceae bacterium]|nr:MFS transporter [Saprospiraceae bacterium]MBK8855916.1 MFS transporter [Saprospiraceae bacterium]MBP6694665.1 MFS transporter [Saprospiraceae bacterium]